MTHVKRDAASQARIAQSLRASLRISLEFGAGVSVCERIESGSVYQSTETQYQGAVSQQIIAPNLRSGIAPRCDARRDASKEVQQCAQ